MGDAADDLTRLEAVERSALVSGASAQLLTRYEDIIADPDLSLSAKAAWLLVVSRVVLRWSQEFVTALLPQQGEAPKTKTAQATPPDLPRLRLEAAALADWLDARTVLGREVFASGGTGGEVAGEADLVAFLWASLVAFEGAAASNARERPTWRVVQLDFPDLAAARERLLLLLEGEARLPLTSLASSLIGEGTGDGEQVSFLRRRGAVAGSFAASLELAKQGEATLTQERPFVDLFIERTASPPSVEESV
ncbi:hypothetical protein LWC05_14405 [Acetobacter sicerae]|uniref:Segregation and condensation protein A n=1 Tax=Acetobacter sicerae TaxID=85325 RepID=A0ABS8VYT0_9PROT|nr:hypothetical protein [Acetobacter sicerae]MCE0745066.1 hypothetical protein [Acetobacter sicerae]